jgi:hypothetical protein
MIHFILGYIAGILTATLIVATLAFFRRVIEHKTTIIEKQIEKVGPKPKGFLIEPDSPIDEARARIIAKNNAAGRPTSLSELQ